jgi:hypothetical protein
MEGSEVLKGRSSSPNQAYTKYFRGLPFTSGKYGIYCDGADNDANEYFSFQYRMPRERCLVLSK